MTKDQLDEAFECFLAGRPVPSGAAPLVHFAEAVRDSSARPGRPSTQLAELLTTGLLTDPAGSPTGTVPTASGFARTASPGHLKRRRTMFGILAAAVAKFASAGAVAQATTGVGLALVSVTGAGAAGVLPGPVQDGVAGVIESVTPFELPDVADRPVLPEQATVPDRAETGRTPENLPGPGDIPSEGQLGTSVSGDAQDGGVDGEQVSSDARATYQPEQPAAPEAPAAERPAERPSAPAGPAAPPAPTGGPAQQGSTDVQAPGGSGRP